MNPFVLFVIGAILGWLLHWLLDMLIWRNRRVCTDAELELRNRVAKYETEYRDYDDLKLRAGRVGDLETRVGELEVERDGLNTRLSGYADIEAERDSLRSKVSNVDTDMKARTDLQGRVGSLESERDSLLKRVEELKSDVAGANKKAAAAAAAGAAAGAAATATADGNWKKKYGSLESERDDLRAKLDACNAKLKDASRKPADLTIGTPSLGGFAIDSNDVASGKFTVEGKGEPKAKVSVYAGNNELGSTNVAANGGWKFSDNISVPAGVHKISARQYGTGGRILGEAQGSSIKLQKKAAPAKAAPPKKAAPAKKSGKPDDLKRVWGIGPKIEKLLHSHGIKTFEALATASGDKLQAIIDEAGPRFRLANHEEWRKQARMCADDNWSALEKEHERLSAERAAGRSS